MFKVLSVLAMMVIACDLSYAQSSYCESLPSFTRDNTNTRQKWEKFCEKQKNAAEVISNANTRAAELQEAANRADVAYYNAKSSLEGAKLAKIADVNDPETVDRIGDAEKNILSKAIYNVASPQGRRINAEINKAKTDLEAKKIALDKANEALAAHDKAVQDAGTYLTNNKKPILSPAEEAALKDFRFENLERTVASQGATITAGVALDNASEVSKKLQELQNKFDQSDTGIYLADKFNQFANSAFACTIQKRCATPPSEKERVPAGEVNELFPELKTYREINQTAEYTRTKSGRTKNQPQTQTKTVK